jgi:hypothetical protein
MTEKQVFSLPPWVKCQEKVDKFVCCSAIKTILSYLTVSFCSRHTLLAELRTFKEHHWQSVPWTERKRQHRLNQVSWNQA